MIVLPHCPSPEPNTLFNFLSLCIFMLYPDPCPYPKLYERSFNFLALYLFMRCMRHGNDGKVSLPNTSLWPLT